MKNDTTDKNKKYPKLSSVIDELNLEDHVTVQSIYGG